MASMQVPFSEQNYVRSEAVSCRRTTGVILPGIFTMRQRDVSTYTLIHKYGINPRTINNLKHNKSITMFTLERLCEILNCEPNDIIKFEKE